MKTSILYSIFLLIIILTSAYADLPLHSRCRTKDNVQGLCVHIGVCAPIMEQIRSGAIRANPPPVCSIKNKTVCCPLEVLKNLARKTNVQQDDIESEIDTQDDDATEYKPPSEASIRIAKKKCEEYAESTKTQIMSLTLKNLSPWKIESSRCQDSAISLIVGGQQAERYEFPHQALIGYEHFPSKDRRYLCGGSLVSPNFVLTAAHCIDLGYDYSYPLVVKLGMNYRLEEGNKVVVMDVDEIYIHDSFTKISLQGDIALLRLRSSVEIDEFILPICLPSKRYDEPEAIATGFGKTENSRRSNSLMKVVLERFNYGECKKSLRQTSFKIDKNSMICYGHRSLEKDSCKGDSGGPIQISNSNSSCTYTQIGIVSFGLKNCGQVGFPGVYVNVHHYLDWIVGIIWKDEL